MRVELAPHVVDFIRSLASEPKRIVRAALHDLEGAAGNTKPLKDELSGYYRLRVGSYPVIFRIVNIDDSPVIRCDYAEKRSVVYRNFKPD